MCKFLNFDLTIGLNFFFKSDLTRLEAVTATRCNFAIVIYCNNIFVEINHYLFIIYLFISARSVIPELVSGPRSKSFLLVKQDQLYLN